MGTDIPKIHWFQEAKTGRTIAVVAPGDLLLSPDLVSAHFVGTPRTEQAIIAALGQGTDTVSVSVLVDMNIHVAGTLQVAIESIPAGLRDRVASFQFLGAFPLVDEELHRQLEGQGEFVRRRTESMMRSVEELSPLDSTGRSLLALKAKKEYSDQEFFRAIEHDTALCAQLLNWGTSAYYGPSATTPTVESVVVRNIGLDKALVLSIGLSVQKAFKIEKDLRPALLDNVTESIYVSTVARSVSNRVFSAHDKHLIPLSGLLYNLGDLVLMQVAPVIYRVYSRYRAYNPAHTAEFVQRITLGFECAQMGTMLAKQWQLPVCVVNVIGCAHLGIDPALRTQTEARIIAFSKRLLVDKGAITKSYEGEIESANMGLKESIVESIVHEFDSKQPYYNMIAQAMMA